jgi:hypothetical protein
VLTLCFADESSAEAFMAFYTGDADEALIQRTALAQPEQEPVAWGWRYDSCGHAVVNRLAVTETPEPTVFLTNVFARGPFPLYTHPPRREWQSLTEEEIDAVLFPYCDNKYEWIDYREVARAIEQACKERNT